MPHKGSEYLHARQVYTAKNETKTWQLEGYNASISGTRVFVFKLSLNKCVVFSKYFEKPVFFQNSLK